MKRCRICKEEKPIEQFSRRTRSRDGLSDRCRDCSRDLMRQWRADNPDYSVANRERARQWTRDNPDRSKARSRKWAKDNPDRIREGSRIRARRAYSKDSSRSLASGKKWRDANREKYLESARKWRKSNLEKVHHNKRVRYARERGAEGSYTSIEWAMLCRWFGNVCLRCGDTAITTDHVVSLEQGGSNYITNLQPLCGSCNSSKSNTTVDYRDPALLAMLIGGMPDGCL